MSGSQNKVLKICLLPGDGVGVEVMQAALPVFAALHIPCELHTGAIGWQAWCDGGNPVPPATWDLIERCDTVLLGAVTSKPLREADADLSPALRGKGFSYVSPVIQLRQRLKLFANVRPAWSLGRDHRHFRLAVIRENTEGLYAGLDFAPVPNDLRQFIRQTSPAKYGHDDQLHQASAAIRLQTRAGLQRLFAFGFDHARTEGFSKLTLADKPNVLRASGNFAREILEDVAASYPEITWDIQNVDALAMNLVRRPEDYGVIVAENMFGDILSDVAAATMGGLGFAPSGNFGGNGSYFEPVHGSAPKHAGKGRVNPSAMFLTIAMLLDHHGFAGEALRIRQAVKRVVQQGSHVTYDLGGSASTEIMAARIIEECLSPTLRKKIGLLSIGDELIRGEVVPSNSAFIAKTLHQQGAELGRQSVVPDDPRLIREALWDLAAQHTAIIVTGGLGPTSDDVTREATAAAAAQDLVFDEAAWSHVKQRMQSFGLAIHDDQKRQALRPAHAQLLPNPHGTALGLRLKISEAQVFLLPGPPKEALPMLETSVVPALAAADFFQPKETCKVRLIGVIESDVSTLVDKLRASLIADCPTAILPISYRFHYPFVDVTITGEDGHAVRSLADSVRLAFADAYLLNPLHAATDTLRAALAAKQLDLDIQDHATNGLLTKRIGGKRSPGRPLLRLELHGLSELTERGQSGGQAQLTLKIDLAGAGRTVQQVVPLRGPEVTVFAAEWAAHHAIRELALRAAAHEECVL